MAKKQFKAESKRLLDLMINSIYTHQEIFLREIISPNSEDFRRCAPLGSPSRGRFPLSGGNVPKGQKG